MTKDRKYMTEKEKKLNAEAGLWKYTDCLASTKKIHYGKPSKQIEGGKLSWELFWPIYPPPFEILVIFRINKNTQSREAMHNMNVYQQPCHSNLG